MKVDQKTRKRFWKMVRKDGASGCWIWIGSKTQGNYGSFGVNGKTVRAHKFCWEMANNRRVPSGLELHHRCTRKDCVRPDHLELVSHGANMAEAARRGVFSGERNGMAKLTDDDALWIRALFALGESPKEFAERFPVKEREIYNVVKGKTWGHVKIPENLPPVDVKEVILDLLPVLEGLYQLRVERGQPLPESFGELCRNCAAILLQ